jgi:hypothetical protein
VVRVRDLFWLRTWHGAEGAWVGPEQGGFEDVIGSVTRFG